LDEPFSEVLALALSFLFISHWKSRNPMNLWPIRRFLLRYSIRRILKKMAAKIQIIQLSDPWSQSRDEALQLWDPCRKESRIYRNQQVYFSFLFHNFYL
jgi:hypothetical protein